MSITNSIPETDKIKNLAHEKLKRLPKNHPVKIQIQTGIMRILSGQATLDDLIEEQKELRNASR